MLKQLLRHTTASRSSASAIKEIGVVHCGQPLLFWVSDSNTSHSNHRTKHLYYSITVILCYSVSNKRVLGTKKKTKERVSIAVIPFVPFIYFVTFEPLIDVILIQLHELCSLSNLVPTERYRLRDKQLTNISILILSQGTDDILVAIGAECPVGR